jgi:hypothetical protein
MRFEELDNRHDVGLGGREAKSTMGLATASFFCWGTGACGALMRARSTPQPQRPHNLQPQEEVARRTLAPTPAMRAGAADRRDSSLASQRRAMAQEGNVRTAELPRCSISVEKSVVQENEPIKRVVGGNHALCV